MCVCVCQNQKCTPPSFQRCILGTSNGMFRMPVMPAMPAASPQDAWHPGFLVQRVWRKRKLMVPKLALRRPPKQRGERCGKAAWALENVSAPPPVPSFHQRSGWRRPSFFHFCFPFTLAFLSSLLFSFQVVHVSPSKHGSGQKVPLCIAHHS